MASKIKITGPTGQYTIIEEGRAPEGVTIESSTAPQPFFYRSYEADGTFRGGRTMSAGIRKSTIERAKAGGAVVEEME